MSGALLAVFGLALVGWGVFMNGAALGQAPTAPAPDVPLASLKSVKVKEPPNLSEFVQDRDTAIQLGKAFFWDMQMGSDGVTACATCHYQAGADVRTKNSLNPGTLATDIPLTSSDLQPTTPDAQGGPNYTLTPADFPFHRLAVGNDSSSAVVSDTNDITGSTGVFNTLFVLPGTNSTNGADICKSVPDATYNVGGINTRRVTGRNAPSAINAVFNYRNFWDGRASDTFNGFNPFGPRDPNLNPATWNPNDPNRAGVLRNISGKLTPTLVLIPFSSLASQAVGPPGSDVEMSCAGRIFPNMGRKLLSVRPLGQQTVSPSDSVLGTLARTDDDNKGRGLNTTYEKVIQRAFKPDLWNSKELTQIGTAQPRFKSELSDDLVRLGSDKKSRQEKGDDETRGKVVIADNRYRQIEANFSLFWGLSIQLYESTLIANDSPVDQYLEGNTSALNADQVAGMGIFMNQGRCINCHGGPETTNASITKVGKERIERMIMGDGNVAVYDDGFYNIGVRPSTEDGGVGGTDKWGKPLSETALCQQQLKAGATCDPSVLNVAARPLEAISAAPLTTDERIAVAGSFKTPGLRNVELTGPYFHNGGQATLREVVDFYDRGGDFADRNKSTLDTDISRIGLDETQKKQLVSFLVGLTDERVRWERAPFDHPELCIPDGHPGNTKAVTNDPKHPGQATDHMTCLPAIGRNGRTATQGALQPFLGLDPQSGGGPSALTPAPVVAHVVPVSTLPTAPAATTASLLASGVTAPGGVIAMGSHMWVADHLLGLCRLDAQADGSLKINMSTCNATGAVAPGQPVFDSAAGYAYVPDASSKSAGVWRLKFDTNSETVGQPQLLISGPGLAGVRTASLALSPDKKSLYVGSLKSPTIWRINDPSGASPTLETVGSTSDTNGVLGIAFVNNDLYLAQSAAVTVIRNPAACSGGCTAEATPIKADAPTALASDGAGVLYVVDTPVDRSVVRRYTFATGVEDVLANAGVQAGASTPLMFVKGLSVDQAGVVYVGDDPAAAQGGQGRVWAVAPV